MDLQASECGRMRTKMKEAEEYIDSTALFAQKCTIETVKQYLSRAGHPENGLRFIHVAGTNGKGSVASKMASCLTQAGFSTGSFISPHLCDIRERMSIDGEMISEKEFLDCFSMARRECESAVREGFPHLKYFEFLFLMAMLWFHEKRPDYVILETGMGGRLDATNSVDDKAVTVITRIGLDHTEYLGDTIGKIAAEKAGILRKGCPAVFLTDPQEAYLRIKERANEIGAPVYKVSQDMWKVNSAGENGIDFSLYNRYDKILRVNIPDRALYQCENAALAATAVSLVLEKEGIGGGKADGIICKGIGKSLWPCRMEEILPHVWIDGAHNPDGIRAFLESVRQITGTDALRGKANRRILLFACASNKDYTQELEMIGRSGLFTDIAAVPMNSSRALGMDILRRTVIGHASGIRFHEAASSEDAVNRFIRGKKSDTEVFAAGSLYFAGELRELLLDARK